MKASLLLVDDHDMFRVQLAEALGARGYEVIEAAGADAALLLAERRRPGLALVDLRMPGKDGIDLLRAMQERPATAGLPVILMTAHARREDIAAGTSLGVRDFLLKSSFSLEELVERIENRVSPSVPEPPQPPASLRNRDLPQPRIARSPSAFASKGPLDSSSSVSGASKGSFPGSDPGVAAAHARLADQAELRALPGPVAEILKLASSNTASLAQVQDVVQRDPFLAERVMSASMAFGVRGTAPVETLEDSLRVLGLEQLVRVVASIPVFRPEELTGRFGSDLAQLWTHGIATGTIAARLAPPAERTLAFLQGLFHVLPSLVGLQSLGDEWPGIEMAARREGRSGVDAMALAFGRSAGPFAEEVLGRMRLPEPIASTVREWHRDRIRRSARSASEACRRLDAASSIATGSGMAWSDLSTVRPIPSEETRSWHGLEAFEADLPLLKRQVRVLQKAAGLPEPLAETVLGELWSSDDLLYWRDPRYRAPDPVETALASRGAKRVETPEPLLENGPATGVACAEPGSPWWRELVESRRELLVIHTSPAPPGAVSATVRLVQAPIPLYLLDEAIGDT